MKILFCIVLCLLFTASFGQTVNDLRPTVTMKEYVDMQSEWQRKLIEVEIENINDNVNKAMVANDKRLDGMNEFRQTLQDSNRSYVTWQTLIALIFGVAGLLFGYANYKKNQHFNSSAGRNIQSGDTVEVKK